MQLEYIEAMMNIHSIEIKGNHITVIYDHLQVTESQLEKRITEVDVLSSDGLLEKIRRAFVHVTVETELALLEARPDSRGGRLH